MPVPYKKHIVDPNEKQNSQPSMETVQKSHKASRERSSYHNNIVMTSTNDLPSCSIQDQHTENLPASSNEPHGNASVIGDWRREKKYHSNSDFDIDESDENFSRTLSGSSSSKSEATSESSVSESEPLLPHPNGKLRRIITVSPAQRQVQCRLPAY